MLLSFFNRSISPPDCRTGLRAEIRGFGFAAVGIKDSRRIVLVSVCHLPVSTSQDVCLRLRVQDKGLL